MVAGCAPKLAKLFLFIFNFTIWAAGVALITVGSYVTAKQAEYTDLFAEDTILVVTGITIGVGCFCFLVGFCGCCGAMKEGACLLKMYWTFLLLIICLEITAGTLAFVYSDEIEESLLKGMTDTIHDVYPTTTSSKEAIDGVQELSECCGATNYTDYRNCAGCESDEAVPESCCMPDVDVTLCQLGTKGNPTFPDLIYPDGCVEASLSVVQDNFVLLGAVCFALLIFEIVTMVFTCCVIDAIQKDEFA